MATQPEEVGIVRLFDTEAARKQIEPMLFPGSDYRRVIQEVFLAVKENPELLECTPASIVRAVSRGVSWGLVIGETVHLVPFNVKVSKKDEVPERWEKRCKALQDYKGKIELIVRSGSARAIDAEDVYENDDFVLELGAHPIVRFRPVLDPKKRGKYIGTYAIARINSSMIKVIWVPADEVDAIHKASKTWGKKPRPYWYGKKTAIHRLAKELPKSERLLKVFGAFREDAEEESAEIVSDDAVLTLGAAPVAAQEGPRPVATAYALTEGPARPISVQRAGEPAQVRVVQPPTEEERARVQRHAEQAAKMPDPYTDGPPIVDGPIFYNEPYVCPDKSCGRTVSASNDHSPDCPSFIE